MIWTSNTIPTGWLRCNGAALNTYEHRELHKIISNTFNTAGSAYQAGVTDIPTATSVFYLPDLITRFPVGATRVGDFTNSQNNLGATENPQLSAANRTVSHNHSGAPHTHTFAHTHNVPAHYHTNENVDGALNITSSGSHTTRIDHDHFGTTPTLTSGNQDLISWSDTGGHTHDGTTTGSVTTTDPAQDYHLGHDHRSWNINSVGPWYDPDRLYGTELNLDHGHNFYSARSASNQGAQASLKVVGTNVVAYHDRNGSFGLDEISSTPESGRATNYNLSIQTSQVRGTPSIPPFTTANSGSLNHRHQFSISTSGAHRHEGGLSMTYKNIDMHPSGSSAGNDLRGIHTHGRANIAGRIGSVSGQNGNSAFSTTSVNQVGGQDPTTSGATYTGTSGNSVSPHLVVHFIIRSTNPQVS
jgi:microcystin-dependent protein